MPFTPDLRLRCRAACATAIAALVIAALAAVPPTGAAGKTVAAADILADVEAGRPIEFDGATVTGDLDLGSVDTARRVIRCTHCAFEGSIRGSNVIFARTVDFSGSTVARDLDFEGAIFRDAFLMRGTSIRRASVSGRTSFSLAAFHSRASFEGIRLRGDADFRVAHFLGNASFGDADFGADARFDSAIFSGQAQFSSSPLADGAVPEPGFETACITQVDGSFVGAAWFVSVSFGEKADFRQRCFNGPATFAGSTFGAADFTLAGFHDAATFDDASIEGLASFRVVTFENDLSFQHVVLRGPTDFESSLLLGNTEFFGTSAADSFSLNDIRTGADLALDKVRANGFEMDLELLNRVHGESVREAVVKMVEVSATARGDLGLANEATFLRSQMRTARAEGSERVLGLAGEEIAGYLVKPIYPLRALGVLVAIGGVVRTLLQLSPLLATAFAAWLSRRRIVPALPGATGGDGAADTAGGAAKSRRPPGQPARTGLLSVGKFVVLVAGSVSATLRAAFRLKPHDVPVDDDEKLSAYAIAILAGFEWLAFKVVITLFLISLANSNPTFKQLVEAVI